MISAEQGAKGQRHKDTKQEMSNLRDIFLPHLEGGVISIVGGGGKTTLMFRLAREIASAGETVLTTTTTKILLPQVTQSPAVLLSPRPGFVLEQAPGYLEKHRHLTAARGLLPGPNKLLGFTAAEIEELAGGGLFRWILVEADGARHRPLKMPARHEPVIPSCSRLVIAVVGLEAIGQPLTEEHVFRSRLFAKRTGLKLGEDVTELAVARALSHTRGIMKGCPAGALRYVFLNKAETKGRLAAGRRTASFLWTIGGILPDRVIIGSLERDKPWEWHERSA